MRRDGRGAVVPWKEGTGGMARTGARGGQRKGTDADHVILRRGRWLLAWRGVARLLLDERPAPAVVGTGGMPTGIRDDCSDGCRFCNSPMNGYTP